MNLIDSLKSSDLKVIRYSSWDCLGEEFVHARALGFVGAGTRIKKVFSIEFTWAESNDVWLIADEDTCRAFISSLSHEAYQEMKAVTDKPFGHSIA